MKKALAVAVVLFVVFAFVPALSAQIDTPEQFKPFVRKWEYTDNPKQPVKFEIFSVDKDGKVAVKYTARTGEVPMKGTAFIDKAGKLHLVLEGGKRAIIRWDLEYYSKGKGMFFGKLESSNYPDPSEVKVYPAD